MKRIKLPKMIYNVNFRKKSKVSIIKTILLIISFIIFISNIDNSSQSPLMQTNITNQELIEYCKEYELWKIKQTINSIVPNLAYRELSESIYDASNYYNIPINLIIALIYRESSFNRYAISSAKCVGYMQIHPYVHTWIDREKMYNTRYNIFAGSKILYTYKLQVKNLYKDYDELLLWEYALIRYNGWVPGSRFGEWVLNKYFKLENV